MDSDVFVLYIVPYVPYIYVFSLALAYYHSQRQGASEITQLYTRVGITSLSRQLAAGRKLLMATNRFVAYVVFDVCMFVCSCKLLMATNQFVAYVVSDVCISYMFVRANC